MMIDNRKMDTAQAIAFGILNIKPPKSDAPDDDSIKYFKAEYCDVPEGFDGEDRDDNFKIALERNMGIKGCMYYGVWRIWPTEKGFSGELIQYRSITDNIKDVSLDDAVNQATEWYRDCNG